MIRRMTFCAAFLAALSAMGGLALAQNGLADSREREAVVQNPAGGPWYEFEFTAVGVPAINGFGTTPSSGGNSIFAGDPPWTFTGPATMVITDAFLYGDSFDVYDFGGFAFGTPLVAGGGGGSDDPDFASVDPLFSHASFAFGPGAHSLTIIPSAIVSGGAGYFTLVPEPSTFVLVGLGGLAMAVVARKRGKRLA